MITNNISLILYVTGMITASMLMVFISPRLVFEKILRVEIASGGLTEILERHWGMAIFVSGLLLIWAGCDPAIRKPVLTCVALNKAVFVGTLFLSHKKVPLLNLAPMIAFDVACVIIYVAYLMGCA